MSEFEDEFLVRPGRIRADRSTKAASFVGHIRQAVQRAADPGQGARRNGGKRSAAGLARGAGRSSRSSRRTARQVIVKARIVRHSGSRYRAAPVGRHIRYLEREGVSRDGESARMFDARSEQADVSAFAERCEDDRHHFRFIVSPKDAGAMSDLRAFTRELMGQAEQDLGTRLDWVAIDHWNTDNPHLHILVRGRGDDGRDLVIAGDYIAQGLRGRTERLVTLELGPRTEREISASLDAEVGADRWTSLDQGLVRRAQGPDRVADLRQQAPSSDDDRRLLGRVGHLAKLGLAEEAGPGRWGLAADLEKRLRDLSIRGDIIKTYHQAMARSDRLPTPERLVIHETPSAGLVGRLVDRGLDDELKGSAYVLIDGVDGRQHHLSFGDLAETTDVAAGGIVEVRGWTDRDGADRRTLAVCSDLSLATQIKAEGATWLDRQILKGAHQGGVGGFGEEVAQAAGERLDVLVGRGLAHEVAGRIRPTANLLGQLRARELDATITQIERATGRSARVAAAGEPLAGTYARRLDLASGRFVMLDDGLGFQLAPWRPGVEAQRGRQLAGTMGPDGVVAWAIGKSRGPAL